MTIRTGLKKKARLAGQMREWTQKLHSAASVPDDTTGRRHSFATCRAKVDEIAAELVELKAKIHRANGPVYSKIFELAEVKNKLSAVKQLNTRDVRPEYDAYAARMAGVTTLPEPVPAPLSEVNRDTWVAELEARVEVLQDELDHFNAVTEI